MNNGVSEEWLFIKRTYERRKKINKMDRICLWGFLKSPSDVMMTVVVCLFVGMSVCAEFIHLQSGRRCVRVCMYVCVCSCMFSRLINPIIFLLKLPLVLALPTIFFHKKIITGSCDLQWLLQLFTNPIFYLYVYLRSLYLAVTLFQMSE